MSETKEIQVQSLSQLVETVVVTGDLAKLSSEQRLDYYKKVCESVGLNPLTKPFDYITLNNKLTLYARKDCTDQLRKIHNVSVKITSREKTGECYVVTALASLPNGRTDESIGAVSLGKSSGDALANLFMKAETKAKRRVTLSICGLGMLDETEVETITEAPLKGKDPIREVSQPHDPLKPTQDQLKALSPLMRRYRWSKEDLVKVCSEGYGASTATQLSLVQYNELVYFIQNGSPDQSLLAIKESQIDADDLDAFINAPEPVWDHPPEAGVHQ